MDELAALDPANRRWLAASFFCRLKEARLARRRGDWGVASQGVADTRAQFEQLVAAEPTDRSFILRLATAWRLEAQLRFAADRPDAAAAAARALELGEKLVREGRSNDVDLGECAYAGIVAGEIAAHAGNGDEARRYWQRAADLLGARPAGTRDWVLLDPAARAALHLGRSAEARAILAKLTLLGYVPLDPWPDPDRADAAKK